MRKAAMWGLGAATLMVLAFVLTPAVRTQARPAPAPRADARLMQLDGRGSSIGVRVLDADREGVRIDEVEEDSPAEAAGLQAGDVVVEFDGERVRSARHFSRLVQETADGRPVSATVLRDGGRRTLEITPRAHAMRDRELLLRLPDIEREVERGLSALPRHFAFDFNWDGPNSGIAIWPGGRIGAQLSPLTNQLAEFFGVKDGVLVSAVEADSVASKAGLKAGDVITAVNGRTVSSPRDIAEEIRSAGDDREVELRVTRDRKEITLKASLPERSRPATRPA